MRRLNNVHFSLMVLKPRGFKIEAPVGSMSGEDARFREGCHLAISLHVGRVRVLSEVSSIQALNRVHEGGAFMV